MVEVYQNLGNDGTLPAPGNDMGLLPAGGLPPNGLQPLTGACQLPPGGGGGTVGPCADLTEEDCAAQSGTFDGRGTACPDLGVSIKPGDTNQDGVLDLSDPVAFLAWFFGGAPLPPNASLCLVNPNSPVPGPATAVGLQVMDWNCDLALDISDATAQLSWQFGTGAAHCDCTDAACSNCIQVVSPDCLDSCTP
jgi:hypothetical protein